MASLHELTAPIPQSIPQTLRKPLESLQGNILHGHGRDRSVQILLSFKVGKQTAVKKWIKRLAKRITSAQQQLDEAEQYRRYSIPGRLFMSFFLSASGYRYLGKDTSNFDDEAFLRGMKAAQHRLNDPPKEDWEEGYRQAIDAMVLLADDDERFLLREARRLLDGVKTHAEIYAVEHGRVMWNTQEEYAVEHFGFVDSRSQPLFFKNDIERERQKRDGTNVWCPGAGPNLVLVPDPYGKETDSTGDVVHHSGSYLVFRKLEQRVRAFKEHEQELAKALGLTGEDTKRAGALIMGRFEDGTPVVLQRTAGRAAPVPNDFNYDADPHGQKCPFLAHIRRVNPREKDIYKTAPRIVRRGITYGKREKEPKDNPSLEELPSGGVGLLFMCYQKSIAEQFEYLQGRLANEPHFSEEQAGIDPIIGQPGKVGAPPQRWPAQWGDPREKHKPFDFHGFVTLKGGEYFFAPSIYFLRHLA